jgi:MOSC domain-containing protein YiiM
MPGRLVSINVSNGGVPKLPVPECRVTKRGLDGDRQRDLRYHGGAERAVSLFSFERIEALRAEGHPIASGTIGENLTVAGLDWGQVLPGARMSVGPVLLELTKFAAPCRHITPSFSDGDGSRVSHKLHPGWSRLYARVLEEGLVRVGDVVALP